ncbi:Os03g0312350 [Oryza sativa Japonica Group]|uniref:Os03g0312350 protein n=1 Tax=Oryza sativa subsp. japonica TaxID=39947 RepID=A0A0P0VWL9_ORYSJ|nr:Os03g0312350 [Oryza sativa Japonica Group]
MPAVLDPACTATARRCSQTSCIFPSPFPMRHSPRSPPPGVFVHRLRHHLLERLRVVHVFFFPNSYAGVHPRVHLSNEVGVLVPHEAVLHTTSWSPMHSGRRRGCNWRLRRGMPCSRWRRRRRGTARGRRRRCCPCRRRTWQSHRWRPPWRRGRRRRS